jgi:hydrogenase nickel incorporation protein HypA/HybF
MHEFSLAQKLFDQALQVQNSNPGTRLQRIEFELGPLSGVEPLQLLSSLEIIVTEACQPGVEVVMHQVPLLARCQNCGQEVEVVDFLFQCSQCGSHDLDILQGDCLKLISVDLAPLQGQSEHEVVPGTE